MPAAPYPPLLAGGDVLQAPPMSAAGLRQRMAEVYNVRAECVLPVRGKWHGVGLVMRLVRGAVAAPASAEFERIARANGAMLAADAPARFLESPDAETGETLSADAAKRAASELEFLVVDEGLIEFADAPSLAGLACDAPNLIVLRDLGQAYGLAGEPCAALIADAALIARLEDLLEPDALSTPAIRAALAVLDPAKAAAYARRFAEVRAEKARIVAALEAALGGGAVEAREGPLAICAVRDPEATQREIARYRADVSVRDGRAFIRIGAPEVNDRALAAFGGLAAARARRRSEVVRETLETRIAVSVDLDTEGQSDIATGVGFYDHMLSQIAAHGGFSVVLRCQGDLEIDTHHTIEDCALALGDALKQALGDRRGIGRFGFVLPMDEAEAKVSLDLGGRPFLVFDAQFTAPMLGEYPVEMTEHVFRSLSQTMGASIHVSVTGENDHHKTEACFKAFGRALRQAVRIEGASLPSTKGMLA